MTARALNADGHGPGWAAAVAELADRAGAVFASGSTAACLSVVDLEPWRRLDAWWLRQRLESIARFSHRPVRYVPCVGAGKLPDGERAGAYAPAWSIGTSPAELYWPARTRWKPDGPVLLLAGDLPGRLQQDLLLAHHGKTQVWGGEPGKQEWQTLEVGRYEDWMDATVRAHATGLPSAMFSMPVGYWQFLHDAFAWAPQGCLVLTRAPGWASLADIRETSTQRGEVRSDSPPVNFHWLGQQVHRLDAKAVTIRTRHGEAVQLVAQGLPDAIELSSLCEPFAPALQSSRASRARAVRALASEGDIEAALSVLQLSAHDPALLRAAWDVLVPRVVAASPPVRKAIGSWLEGLLTDNPWIGEDAVLLRAAGHLALACSRPDLAQSALRALEEQGYALAADVAARARCLEQLGGFDEALAACARALMLHAGHKESVAIRDRITARLATFKAPWRVQHGSAESPLVLDPLHIDHAPMLLCQIRDPSIPVMTALPALADGEDGKAWIEKRLEDGSAAYAIVHRQLGFVGYVDLRLWEKTAFLCYWIGADYQGLGLCSPAVEMGCELAWRNGVELLLSSAYDDNERSLRVLRKQGFRLMDVRAAAPDSDRSFVMLSAAPMSEDEGMRRLVEFCERTNSGLRFGEESAPAQQAGATSGADRAT
ncbi:GNAT family N-acetyltransferase [Caenimonas sp. SL110]|uniref:GNAT family N-acetyltransferase n=1 Tax=Caenimonas sp. SL110 TaxID=1450524 RepID=UPI000652B0F3|nr:GNAT family N-acetyltransferase [Caenimonas sp. SL110]